MKRAPQFCSKSMSPYLMSNNFTLDLSDLIEEIKKAREKKEVQKRYEEMSVDDL